MANLGLGSTFDGFGPGLDFSATISTCSGRRALAIDIARRFTYARGHWPRSPARGFDLKAQLSASGVTGSYINAKCTEQAEQDERVLNASVTVTTHSNDPNHIQIHLRLTDRDGPFEAVVEFPDLTVELLREVN
jgi:hypothetical protein